MKDKEFKKIDRVLKKHKNKFVSIRNIQTKFPQKNISDFIFEFFYRLIFIIKKYVA